MSDTGMPPLQRVHEQVRDVLPVPEAACLDDNHQQARIDYFGDLDRLGELLSQLHELADRHGWVEEDGSVQLIIGGLRLTLSSNFPR